MSHTIRLFNVISRTLVGGVLHLFRNAVGVFYSPYKVGHLFQVSKRHHTKTLIKCLKLEIILNSIYTIIFPEYLLGSPHSIVPSMLVSVILVSEFKLASLGWFVRWVESSCTTTVLLSAASRILFMHAAFLHSSYPAFSPNVSLKFWWCNHSVILTWFELGKILHFIISKRSNFHMVDN